LILRICAVTTWPPYREGVAIYSAKLYSQIAKYAQVIIVANKVNFRGHFDSSKFFNIKLIRSWKRENPFCLLRILNEMIKSKADVFHIQFGWLLYGSPLITCFFPYLILLLFCITQKPVVVTLHSVIRRDVTFSEKRLIDCMIRNVVFVITKLLTLFSSKVIVHNVLMKKTLEEDYGCDENKLVIIPHGVEKAEIEEGCIGDTSERKNLNIISLGFIRQSKGLETLIEAFLKLRVEYPDINLILIGGRHPHDSEEYFTNFKKLIKNLENRSNISLKNFVTEKELNDIIRNATIIVLLSRETKFLEASGALARVSDFNKPVICNRVPKFLGEFKGRPDCCVMLRHGTTTELYDALKYLLENPAFRRKISSNLKIAFRKRYWMDVAKTHMELYRTLLNK